jgi:hypothetical protein
MHYAIFEHKQYILQFFWNQTAVNLGYHTSQGAVTDEHEAELSGNMQRKAGKAQRKTCSSTTLFTK